MIAKSFKLERFLQTPPDLRALKGTLRIPTDISRPTAFRLNGEHRRPFTQIRPKPYLVQDILGWNLTPY